MFMVPRKPTLEQDDLQNKFMRKKSSISRRRQMELVSRGDAVREMYHDVVTSVLDLYKDNNTDLRTWQHFRSAADKLTEMHKFMKLTVSNLYELGALEGAASYSLEFLTKLRELSENGESEYVPFEYLRDYLTEPGDPPPRTLNEHRPLRRHRRARRIPVRFRSPSPVDQTLTCEHWIRDDTVSGNASPVLDLSTNHSTTNNTCIVLPSSSCSCSFDDPARKRLRFSPSASPQFIQIVPTASSESESHQREDAGAFVTRRDIGCLCDADPDGECFTDCSSSTSTTNEEDDVDSLHNPAYSPCHSSPGVDVNFD